MQQVQASIIIILELLLDSFNFLAQDTPVGDRYTQTDVTLCTLRDRPHLLPAVLPLHEAVPAAACRSIAQLGTSESGCICLHATHATDACCLQILATFGISLFPRASIHLLPWQQQPVPAPHRAHAVFPESISSAISDQDAGARPVFLRLLAQQTR